MTGGHIWLSADELSAPAGCISPSSLWDPAGLSFLSSHVPRALCVHQGPSLGCFCQHTTRPASRSPCSTSPGLWRTPRGQRVLASWMLPPGMSVINHAGKESDPSAPSAWLHRGQGTPQTGPLSAVHRPEPPAHTRGLGRSSQAPIQRAEGTQGWEHSGPPHRGLLCSALLLTGWCPTRHPSSAWNKDSA